MEGCGENTAAFLITKGINTFLRCKFLSTVQRILALICRHASPVCLTTY